MSEATLHGPYLPDLPARRLPWVLAGAVLLVLLAFLGIGHVLRAPPHPQARPKPLETQIYELPNSPGTLPAAPHPARPSAHGGRQPGHAATASPPPTGHTPRNTRTAPAHHPAAKPHAAPPSHVSASPAGQPEPPAAAQQAPAKTAARPPPPAREAPPRSAPKLNWAALHASVQSAVAQTARAGEVAAPPADSTPEDPASLPNIHDPHTLVARYYIATLLRKLQRVGDMNYPTDQIGTPVLKLVIGDQGELQEVTLIQSSGNDTLDQNAVQIARESAPFPPFPDSLRRKTSHIVLECHMSFEGYRQINPQF